MTVIAARPTTYKGIAMRSRLEARFAAFLDRAGLTWEYEPRAFATEKGQYLPDFLVRDFGALTRLYIEVKGPRSPWSETERMHLILSSDRGASLAFLSAASADRNIQSWAALGLPGFDHWCFGGLALCACGHPRFFVPFLYFLTVDQMAGRSEEQMDEPVVICECEQPRVVLYLNPFTS